MKLHRVWVRVGKPLWVVSCVLWALGCEPRREVPTAAPEPETAGAREPSAGAEESTSPSKAVMPPPSVLDAMQVREPATADSTLALGLRWLADFPLEHLRFDAATVLSQVAALRSDPNLDRALASARERADLDADNPMRRLWVPELSVPEETVRGWEPPTDGSRANTNRPIIEALWCDVYGLRPQTLDYVTGPMRDAGGYHTTHAMWALVVARDRGCISPTDFDRLAAPLLDELRAAQPASFTAQATLDVDLYGERLLMLLLAGDRDVAAWVATLVALQNPDGSWGIADPSEPPYYRYHATMVAVWALALWERVADK